MTSNLENLLPLSPATEDDDEFTKLRQQVESLEKKLKSTKKKANKMIRNVRKENRNREADLEDRIEQLEKRVDQYTIQAEYCTCRSWVIFGQPLCAKKTSSETRSSSTPDCWIVS